MSLNGIKLGFAITGSFCTIEAALKQLRALVEAGAQVTPIFSFNTAKLDTRFYEAEELRQIVENMTGTDVLDTIEAVEPIGPKALLDIMVVAPCTGNTLAKLALGVTDTPVVMACKAHLRNARPIVLALSTNDGLGASAKNIGLLSNSKHIYFVPYGQDNAQKKPNSLVAKLELLGDTIEAALSGNQLQPVFV